MSKKYDYVLQQNTTDCGIASLMTILMYYGIKPSREKIIASLNKKDLGYTAYDIVKTAKLYGLNAYGIKDEILNLKRLPVIAHVIKDENMFHFIVIFEIDKKSKTLKIMDPAEGLKTISFDEFDKITTNIFLLFDGLKKTKLKDKRFKKELIKISRNNKRIILKTLFLSIIYVVFSLIFNYYLRIVLSFNNISILLCIMIIFLVIVIIKNLLNHLKNKLVLDLSIKIDKDITVKLTNHILNLPYKYFIKKQTGELVTIVEDIENFKEIVIKVFILSLVDLILIGVILIYTSFLNFYIAISIIFMMLVIYIITKKYQYVFNDIFVKYKIKKIDYSSNLITCLTSFETIKNLNISKNIGSRLNDKYNSCLKTDKTYQNKINNYNFIYTLLIDLSYVAIIFFASYISIRNGIEVLDIVLFSSIFYLVIGLFGNITESISFYKVYETATDRVLDCLEVKEEEFLENKFSSVNEIIYKDVCFKSNDIDLLNNINLKINKGDKVYITGDSGIGKSTLMRLLLRYYEITSGKILIDGIHLNDLELSFVRESFTYISQNEELFSGSIKDNLSIVSGDEEKIKEVFGITLIDKMFLKNRIDSNFLIEEGAVNLSGGEKKKIILARGLLHFKNVLILDEVFNEISISEEREILNNILLKYTDKIIIMISHRNSNKDLFNKKIILRGDGSLYETK